MKFFFLYILISSYLYICTFNAFAQPSLIDSLKNLIATDSNDTLKANHLNLLSRHLMMTGKIEEAKTIIQQTLILSRKISYRKGEAEALNYEGISYSLQDDYVNALKKHLQSLKIKEELADTAAMADSYNNIGLVFGNQQDYKKSLEYHLLSLNLRTTLLEKARLLHDEKAVISGERGISNSYNNIGFVYEKSENLEEAIKNYLMALSIKTKHNDKYSIAGIMSNIGIIHRKKGGFKEANRYFTDVLKLQLEIGDNINLCKTYLNLGDACKEINKLDESEKYLHHAILLSKENGLKATISESYMQLSKLEEKRNNYRKAFDYHKMMTLYKDSIFSEESSRQITEMSTKYETEKKEKEILLLNKDKEIQSKDLERQKTIRNAVAGGLLLVILFSFVLINRLLLIRKQKKVIEIEREKSEKLLLNILPKETADELKHKNTVTPKHYDMVTVMFTDFKGFTTIAEKMSAEELVTELDFIFKKFDEIISKYPIEKIKTIGDAYMCAGGVPVANTTNPMDVLSAALEICEWMKSRQEATAGSSEERQLHSATATANWQIRIGIHTGPVIAGVVGDKKFAYDIWGDTVNTASRMESSGEAGKVNISGTTYNMLVRATESVAPAGIPLQFIFRGKIPAKNKGEIEMYFVEKKV